MATTNIRSHNGEGDAWQDALATMPSTRVTLGRQASHQWLEKPDHLCMVLARYRAAAALIGNAETVLEIGCGEGIGVGILARGRHRYAGMDPDEEALEGISNRTIRVVETMIRPCEIEFAATSMIFWPEWSEAFDAAVSLDVIEHVPAEKETAFMAGICTALREQGICVIGTPNARFFDLASPQSKAGHINTYTHDRLYALMTRHFRVVQSFGLNDVSLHTGHPEARHYLMMTGIGPR